MGGYAPPRPEGCWCVAQFRDAGLEIIAEANIAPDVVRGLDTVKDSKRATIHRYVPRFLRGYVEDFAGIPGTRVYESLREGTRRILVLRGAKKK